MNDLNALSSYEYELPEELIAREPFQTRDECRLLALDRGSGALRHLVFRDILTLIPEGAVLVLNNSKVFPARLFTMKESGGKCELLFLHLTANDRARVLLKGRGVKTGSRLTTRRGESLIVGESADGDIEIALEEKSPRGLIDIWLREGEMPLPPYIVKARERRGEPKIRAEDRFNYQTVFAKSMGSVAAPTAGLHFTPELLTAIKSRGIEIAELTLHVGWGTFQPIRTASILDHSMHEESFLLDEETARRIDQAKREKRPVIAVGTTSVRALESAFSESRNGLRSGLQTTSLFIKPGYPFRVVDGMITNFHLPHSSLLVMLSAFAGPESLKTAYAAAIREKYRFYSYGDAMWVL